MAKADSLQKHYQALPRVKRYSVSALLSTLAKKLQKLFESCFQNVYMICLKQQRTEENSTSSNKTKNKNKFPCPLVLGDGGASAGEFCHGPKEKGKKLILPMRSHGKEVLQEHSRSTNNF